MMTMMFLTVVMLQTSMIDSTLATWYSQCPGRETQSTPNPKDSMMTVILQSWQALKRVSYKGSYRSPWGVLAWKHTPTPVPIWNFLLSVGA